MAGITRQKTATYYTTIKHWTAERAEIRKFEAEGQERGGVLEDGAATPSPPIMGPGRVL